MWPAEQWFGAKAHRPLLKDRLPAQGGKDQLTFVSAELGPRALNQRFIHFEQRLTSKNKGEYAVRRCALFAYVVKLIA